MVDEVGIDRILEVPTLVLHSSGSVLSHDTIMIFASGSARVLSFQL
jgi:hypothetical protein